MPTMIVKDHVGADVVVNTLPASGRVADANSLPMALSNEDVILLQAITTALGPVATQATLASILTALASVAVTGPLTSAQLTTAALATSAGQTTAHTDAASILAALASVAVTGPLTSAQLTAASLATAAAQATAQTSLTAIATSTAANSTHTDAVAAQVSLSSIQASATASATASGQTTAHTDSGLVLAALGTPMQAGGALTAAQLTTAALSTHADALNIISAVNAPTPTGGNVIGGINNLPATVDTNAGAPSASTPRVVQASIPVISTAALASSLLLKGAGGVVSGFDCYSAVSGWVMLVNINALANLPASGAAIAPTKAFEVPAGGQAEFAFNPPLAMPVGAVLAFSSTGPLVFTPSATAFMTGQVQ